VGRGLIFRMGVADFGSFGSIFWEFGDIDFSNGGPSPLPL
jgi:hypothetical protein